jgi:hypothetical protein
MSSRKALIRKYSSYSNDKLLEILKVHYEYSQDQLNAAKKVIEERGISVEEVHRFNSDHIRQEILEKVAIIPMTFWEKTLFFFTWIIPFLFARFLGVNYRENGLIMKSKQRVYFSIVGIVSIILIAFLFDFFDLTKSQSFALWISIFLVSYLVETQISWIKD